MSVDDPDGAGAATGLVVDSIGEWDIPQRLGFTRVSTDESKSDSLEITTIMVQGDAWTQALYAGSPFTPDCWLASPTEARQSDVLLPAAIMAVLDLDGRVIDDEPAATMLASDALGAIGLQKAANSLAGSGGDERVPVEVIVTSGVLSGWSVTGEDLSPYLLPQLDVQGSSVEETLNSLTWSVDYSGLGEPVRVQPPPRPKIMAPGETCSG